MEPQQKIRGVSITLYILVWVIAIPPVNDALPGDQNSIGCPLNYQLSFGYLKLMLRGIPNNFKKIFKS